MIIERKYVPFQTLINRDEKAREIFMTAFNKSYPKEDRDRVFALLAWQCLNDREMGWCFSYLGDVIDGFEKLDNENPYDNGFSYDDVTDVEIAWKEQEEITLHLINKCDGIKQIVKIEVLK